MLLERSCLAVSVVGAVPFLDDDFVIMNTDEVIGEQRLNI